MRRPRQQLTPEELRRREELQDKWNSEVFEQVLEWCAIPQILQEVSWLIEQAERVDPDSDATLDAWGFPRTARVLLVEDDPRKVEVFEEWFEVFEAPDWGYSTLELTVLPSGHPALHEIGSMGPATYAGIILDTDVGVSKQFANPMAVRSGRAIANALVERRMPHIPVLIASVDRGAVAAMEEPLCSRNLVDYLPFFDLQSEVNGQRAIDHWLTHSCVIPYGTFARHWRDRHPTLGWLKKNLASVRRRVEDFEATLGDRSDDGGPAREG